MKFLFVFLTCFIAFTALAKENVIGRARIEVTLTYSNSGPYITDIRQVGESILGQSFWGPITMVNLDTTNNNYFGPSGGKGSTALKCTKTACDGFIGGTPAFFSSQTDMFNSGFDYSYSGTIANNLVWVKRSATELHIGGARGFMDLVKKRNGVYEGTGAFGWALNSRFDVRVISSGELEDLQCPALVAIFLAAPVSQDRLTMR